MHRRIAGTVGRGKIRHDVQASRKGRKEREKDEEFGS